MREKRLYLKNIKWAIEEDIGHASPLSRVEQRNNNNTIVWLDIHELQKFMPKETSSSTKLIIKSISQIKEKNFLSPIKVHVYNEQILFEDGLHRIFAALKTNNLYIPALIEKKQVKDLKSLLRVYSKEPLQEKSPE